MSTLQGRLIRAAYQDKSLRPHLLPLLVASAPANWDTEVKQIDLLRKRMQNLRKKVTDLDSVPPLLPKFIAFGEQAVTIAEATLKAQELAAASLTNSRLANFLASAHRVIADLERLNSAPLEYTSNVSYLYGTAMDIPYHYDRILKDLWYSLRSATSYIQVLSQKR